MDYALFAQVLWLTLPLIRYRMSDALRVSTDTCIFRKAFPLIEAPSGRTEEVLLLPGFANNTVRIHPNVLHRVLDLVPSGGWQAVQNGTDLEVVNIGDNVDAEDLGRKLEATLLGYGAHPRSVLAHRVERIPRSPSGKAPLVKVVQPLVARAEQLVRR